MSTKKSNSHIFDPKNIEVLESEDRKTWQNPKKIIERLNLKSNYIVADLGSGSGYFSIPISRIVKKVYSIDVQEEMLDFLEKKIQGQKITNIELILSKGNDVPLQESSVDLLLSVNTLHEFNDKDLIIEEIKRVLKPNGKAAIVDFKKEETDFGPPVTIRVSEDQAIHLFEKHGLNTTLSYDLTYHYLIMFEKKYVLEGVR